MRRTATFDIFCKVIDNFGDAGVCWRLARQLAAEHGLRVRLWVDNLDVLHKLEPAVDATRGRQRCRGVEIRRWDDNAAAAMPADVVIEAFACQLPARYLEAMARCVPVPRWINLEYLSAEAWVRSHHGLPSPQPRLPLTEYFFFPGFGPESGGLLRECGLFDARCAFRADPQQQEEFWRGFGLPPTRAGELRVSLFCYDNPGIQPLLEAWAGAARPLLCLMPEGPALARAAEFFGGVPAAPGDVFERGSLRLRVLPFVAQDRYDRLLWACDCNFVRGEDSLVRAQWAARPLVWQIYPQAGEAHLPKLDAFLDLYCAELPAPAAAAQRALTLAWNGAATGLTTAWEQFLGQHDALVAHAERWADALGARPDLARNLVEFAQALV